MGAHNAPVGVALQPGPSKAFHPQPPQEVPKTSRDPEGQHEPRDILNPAWSDSDARSGAQSSAVGSCIGMLEASSSTQQARSSPDQLLKTYKARHCLSLAPNPRRWT